MKKMYKIISIMIIFCLVGVQMITSPVLNAAGGIEQYML